MGIFAAFTDVKGSSFSWMILVVVALMAYVGAFPETVHVVQRDQEGYVVQMDVTFDIEDQTVHVVVGDVSQYEGSVQTVNFHDYNTSYGVLKIINKKKCLLAHTFVPMASAEKFRQGYVTEVQEHKLRFAPDKLTNKDVEVIAGPKIAAFCKDYDTYFTIATAVEKDRDSLAKVASRQKRALASQTKKAWCFISICLWENDL